MIIFGGDDKAEVTLFLEVYDSEQYVPFWFLLGNQIEENY